MKFISPTNSNLIFKKFSVGFFFQLPFSLVWENWNLKSSARTQLIKSNMMLRGLSCPTSRTNPVADLHIGTPFLNLIFLLSLSHGFYNEIKQYTDWLTSQNVTRILHVLSLREITWHCVQRQRQNFYRCPLLERPRDNVPDHSE